MGDQQLKSAKEQGKKCLERRVASIERLNNVANLMVQELNTKPLVVIPISTEPGDRFLLAFVLGENRFCPIGVLETTEDIQKATKQVYLHDKYTLVAQDNVPGFKEYNSGELWTLVSLKDLPEVPPLTG